MLRNASAVVIILALAVALAAGGLGARPQGDLGGLELRSGTTSFEVGAQAKDFHPGATKRLIVEVANNEPFDLRVTSLAVKVRNASTSCIADNLRVPVTMEPFVVRAHHSHVNGTAASVRMIADADDACQGARFPLKLTLTAVKR